MTVKLDSERSELIEHAGVRHAPENEMGVVLLFAKLHRQLGFKVIDKIQPHFPDCWAIETRGSGTRPCWIECEYKSRTLKTHLRQLRSVRKHPGYVVCWNHDWPECERYVDKVIDLRDALGLGRRVWIQSSLPKYHNELDTVSKKEKYGTTWTVAGRARPHDILFMWRAGNKKAARRYHAEKDRLQSCANIFEITSFPDSGGHFSRWAYVRQICKLREPLRLDLIKSDRILRDASWVRGKMRGRPNVTPYWWRMYGLLLELNPSLKRDLRFLSCAPDQL